MLFQDLVDAAPDVGAFLLLVGPQAMDLRTRRLLRKLVALFEPAQRMAKSSEAVLRNRPV